MVHFTTQTNSEAIQMSTNDISTYAYLLVFVHPPALLPRNLEESYARYPERTCTAPPSVDTTNLTILVQNHSNISHYKCHFVFILM